MSLSQFSLRGLLASVGFAAIYLAIAIPNAAAFLENRIHLVSQRYSFVWLVVVVGGSIMLPAFIQLRLKTPAIAFLIASTCTLFMNYIVPIGML